MNANKPLTIESIVSDANAFIEKLEIELTNLSKVLLGDGFVVINSGFPLQFEIVDGVARNPKSVGGSAANAQRFTKRDAEALAAACVNGNGDKPEAMHVTAALKMQIEEQRALIAMIQQGGAA